MKYTKMTKNQLTAIATERNITVDEKATKAAIITALEAYDAEHPVEGEEKGTEQVVEGKEKVTKMTAEELVEALEAIIETPGITFKEGINARKGSIIVNDGKSRICRVSPTRKHTFTIVTSDGKRETVEDLEVVARMVEDHRMQAAIKKAAKEEAKEAKRAAAEAKKAAKKAAKAEEPKTEEPADK